MNTKIEIRQGDIIEFEGDAIVSPANTSLGGGGGLCGYIFQEAGPEELAKACRKIGFCDFGDVVIMPQFKLKAKYIIHTPTPAYGQHNGDDPQKFSRAAIGSLCGWLKKRELSQLPFRC